ncbi:hypothetical protein ACJ3XI_07485 [Litorimonas sp. RW-G-Af-16]|uniref:hypothetical protein n=1 Tax=Litorimonas sp. RW-G-Af-16 TaxID=3241168 RepID=UPI00390CD31E
MKAGLPISLLLHAAVFAGFGWMGGAAKPLQEGRVIPIELITIAPETNVRAAIRKPDPKPLEADDPMTLVNPMEAAPDEDDAVKVAPKDNSAPVKQAEAVIPEVDEKAIPTPDTPEPPEETKPSFDLDKLAALVDKSKTTAPEKNQQKTLQGETDNINYESVNRAGTGAGTAMTLSELDALQSAMYKCWRMPADAKDPQDLIVRLDVSMLRGGFVEDVKVIDRAKSRRSSPGNPFWDVAEQRAVRAVQQCAPYDFLPDEKYMQWQSITLNFRPQI